MGEAGALSVFSGWIQAAYLPSSAFIAAEPAHAKILIEWVRVFGFGLCGTCLRYPIHIKPESHGSAGFVYQV